MRAQTQQGVFVMTITGATLLIRGRLGGKPELRFTKGGQAVTNFSIAVEQGYGDNKRTEWVRVAIWGQQAEIVNQHLSTGDLVSCIAQNFSINAYVAKDGSVRGQLEITARRVDYIITRRNPSEAPPDEDSEDIPF
jgi:single-strand DNA-binding protein